MRVSRLLVKSVGAAVRSGLRWPSVLGVPESLCLTRADAHCRIRLWKEARPIPPFVPHGAGAVVRGVVRLFSQ
jgi:hypothetical protein